MFLNTERVKQNVFALFGARELPHLVTLVQNQAGV